VSSRDGKGVRGYDAPLMIVDEYVGFAHTLDEVLSGPNLANGPVAAHPAHWEPAPGTVPAVSSFCVICRYTEGGLYHEEAFGPFEASEDDFTAIPAAIEKVETAFVEAHPDAAQVGVGIYLLKSLGGGDG